MTFDVIVLGFGYAGAMAAISAADAGAKVLLIEKAPAPGGISICSAGGVRVAHDAQAALAYLKATNGDTAPEDVLAQLANGMTELPDRLDALSQGFGVQLGRRDSPGNYPFEGTDTFGFVYVEAMEGFDPGRAWPHVRGNPQGALLFRLLEQNVLRRDTITVRYGQPAERLLASEAGVAGVRLADGDEISGKVVLATGGFEASPAMQAQYWAGGPALSAAYAHNTGDGIRMAQAAGADLWHMWHYHGCYGFAVPGHRFGVRAKRLPDWLPGPDGLPEDDVPPMAWILLDANGQRFMNEYEPYLQDTGARALGAMDTARQTMPRNPAWLVTDQAGLALYPLGKPTWNDADAGYDWSADNAAEIASGVFRQAPDTTSLAATIGAAEDTVSASLAEWNAGCAAARDRLGRPPSSMRPLEPPYCAAPVVPIVSNTQGGPRHDDRQRVLDPFGDHVPGLWAAGECGSVFGHLYLSGGNIAECFVGGEIAGREAAYAASKSNA